MNQSKMKGEDFDGEEEEGVNLNDDNPFSFIEEIKLVMDEQDNALLDKAIEKALKKQIEEKKDEIDDRMTRNFANVLMVLSVREVITLNIVLMIRLIQSTGGANIF